MAVVRLANLDDYEFIEILGKPMFKIVWCHMLCPGNPTDDCVEGLTAFNEYQCSVAAGLDPKAEPAEKLESIVNWVVSAETNASRLIANEIVQANRNEGYFVGLEFNTEHFGEPELGYRYELAFLNTPIKALPASLIIQLQNIMQVTNND
ncbi:hypothetical protein [Pseudomonas syringae group genomosp. 3]|uniref:Uncharacterized protein n=1 Tax=Pseudomonas syringae pv. coriandricola TaxID=264453 RepID=A0A3M3JMX1_9PSED|nr:hypothetical protein [Pseudomonas syringae group genomosp. 3]RMN12109.1 hypothetical protein ALQ65_200036 [Pseudomonas syringae pv. coriandricola]